MGDLTYAAVERLADRLAKDGRLTVQAPLVRFSFSRGNKIFGLEFATSAAYKKRRRRRGYR